VLLGILGGRTLAKSSSCLTPLGHWL